VAREALEPRLSHESATFSRSRRLSHRVTSTVYAMREIPMWVN
jgi:hypothetical protein